MKRVVFFGPGFKEVGGAQKRARILTRGLARRGWDVKAVNRAGTRNRFGLVSGERLRAIDVPGFAARWIGAFLYLVIGLFLGLVWGARASVLVAMQVGSQTLVTALCGVALRKPFVVLTTSSGMLSELDILRHGRLSGLRRWAIRRAAFVVVQTEEAARELDGVVDSGRTRIMRNPVESDGPLPLNGEARVLFMGRLSEEKDLPNLLQAWREIAAARPEAELTLLGEGGHFRSVEEALEGIVESDGTLRRSVRMPGWSDDPPAFLERADVFVFPSLSEGMSNSLLEACAAGRVVVASAISSNLAVLGSDYPLLFEPGDVDAMRRTLERALGDASLRAAAVEHCGARMENFDVDRVLDVFEGLLTDAQHRARHLDT